MNINSCLICKNKSLKKYLSLGQQPLANNLSKKILVKKYPLEIFFCKKCFHNQLGYEVKKEKLFSKYLYLSSQSKTLQNHFDKAAYKYIKRFNLNKNSRIVDVGSNDGIALRYFKKKNFFNYLGIEPAKNVAQIANKNGINTLNSFLNMKLANKYFNTVDLLLASNVFAHNRNISNLLDNLIKILKKDGVLVIEVQYLLSMLKENLFDNIYHEHIHYWSVSSLNSLLKKKSCSIYDVELINTHGGSVRIYVKKKKNLKSKNLLKILKQEIQFGIFKQSTYNKFKINLENKKKKFLNFLKVNKKCSVIGYGAAAKASTVLNYLNISDQIKYIIDDNKIKQGRYIPGTSIKVIKRSFYKNEIDYLIVFAWNYFSEIKEKIKYAKKVISIRNFF
jgi:SAM-dependent methyltransferase